MLKKRIREITQEYIDAKIFPGCAIKFGNDRNVFFEDCIGTVDERKPMNKDILFDVASLSKVIGTLPAILVLFQEGKIDIEDKVKKYIPIQSENILIRHLLTHTSGMQPYSTSYKYAENPEELINELYQIAPLREPEKEVVYSCLNFIFLKKVVDAVTGDFKSFVNDSVFKPLEMYNTCYVPEKLENVAPTSYRDGARIKGMPDDELAYYLGGVSGNAGVFSNIDEVFKYGCEWLNPTNILSKATVKMVLRKWTEGINGDKKGLGWMLYTNRCSGGSLLSDKAFGHTGFTGTSLWIDPENELVMTILTNRCFYQRHTTKDEIWEFRRRIHHTLVSAYTKG